jgi:hypothetical protein
MQKWWNCIRLPLLMLSAAPKPTCALPGLWLNGMKNSRLHNFGPAVYSRTMVMPSLNPCSSRCRSNIRRPACRCDTAVHTANDHGMANLEKTLHPLLALPPRTGEGLVGMAPFMTGVLKISGV